MYADLDELVLSGKLFNPASRSPSPRRSPSPDAKRNTDWPELNGGEEGGNDEEAAHEKRQIDRILASPSQDGPGSGENIGLGPGRTGVKGVLRDQAEAEARARKTRAQQRSAAKSSVGVGGKTYLEEEREAQWEKMMLEGLDDVRPASTMNGIGRFGHLREVGMKGFVDAVEKEERGVWVVVHIYEQSLDRCYDLDSILTRLAPLNRQTKFLRTRAGPLGFASKPHQHPQSRSTKSGIRSSRIQEEAEEEDNEGDEEGDDDNVDLDMLPTMLVYRDGELIHNWVRVDWEAGKAGVEDLLRKHNILSSQAGSGMGNCGLPSDDDDLTFESDDDDRL